MKRLLIILTIASLTGCGVSRYRPATLGEVERYPDDCKNRQLMITQLQNYIDIPKAVWVSQDDYDAKISAYKQKIWHLRYVCQPA